MKDGGVGSKWKRKRKVEGRKKRTRHKIGKPKRTFCEERDRVFEPRTFVGIIPRSRTEDKGNASREQYKRESLLEFMERIILPRMLVTIKGERQTCTAADVGRQLLCGLVYS